MVVFKMVVNKNRCPLEGASSGTPLMILLQLSKRGSKTGLVINAPAKYAATFILFFVLSIFFL